MAEKIPEPVEDIDKELLEREEQSGKVHLDNLKTYAAVLKETISGTRQQKQEFQIKALLDTDIADEFEKLVATQLTYLFPQLAQKHLKRSLEPILRGQRALPSFPPGGPRYSDRIVVRGYTILEKSLSVCKITEQEYVRSVDVDFVHVLQDFEIHKVCPAVEYTPARLPIPDSCVPTTREGEPIAVRSFARVLELITYLDCFDPPLGPDTVPLNNPEEKSKDLGK
ncbi:hypothetical protein EAE96_011032 [Botrytis aclada]|nr:hypothetical protein EAE96_011032 [Botrytis aclada]